MGTGTLHKSQVCIHFQLRFPSGPPEKCTGAWSKLCPQPEIWTAIRFDGIWPCTCFKLCKGWRETSLSIYKRQYGAKKKKKNPELGRRQKWALFSALSLTCCVTLSQSLPFFLPPFPLWRWCRHGVRSHLSSSKWLLTSHRPQCLQILISVTTSAQFLIICIISV